MAIDYSFPNACWLSALVSFLNNNKSHLYPLNLAINLLQKGVYNFLLSEMIKTVNFRNQMMTKKSPLENIRIAFVIYARFLLLKLVLVGVVGDLGLFNDTDCLITCSNDDVGIIRVNP